MNSFKSPASVQETFKVIFVFQALDYHNERPDSSLRSRSVEPRERIFMKNHNRKNFPPEGQLFLRSGDKNFACVRIL